MNRPSPACTAYSTDTQDRVEQYFHIVEVLGRKGGTAGRLYIVLEFARYTYQSGEVVNKTLSWHGPFASTRLAKELIGSLKPGAPTRGDAPSEGRTVARI